MRVKLSSILMLMLLVGCSVLPFGPGANSPTGTSMPEESQLPPNTTPSESSGTASPIATMAGATATQQGCLFT